MIKEEEKIDTRNSRKKQTIIQSDEDKIDEYKLIQIDSIQVQLEEDMMANDRACHLCSRSDGELLGPFGKTKFPHRSMLYFHKDCIEVSNISCYSKQQ